MTRSQPLPDPQIGRLAALLEQLVALRAEVLTEGRRRLAQRAEGEGDKSACNLAHYLALRRHDLRPLQTQLAQLSLSSLGRAEAHVAASLNGLIDLLSRALGRTTPIPASCPSPDFGEGDEHLVANSAALFGAAREGRAVRIMVTLPSQAAEDGRLVRRLLAAGMDCARINCAHDGPLVWQLMVTQVRAAAAEMGRDCRILMDLAGHKLRTGAIAPGPAVLHLRTGKDAFGDVTTPALLHFRVEGTAATTGLGGREYSLALPASIHARLAHADRLYFQDTRGKPRRIDLLRRTPAGEWLAECWQNAYLADGIRIEWRRGDETLGFFGLAEVPQAPAEVRIFPGEALLLTGDHTPGRPARRDENGRLLEPASIPCTLPQILERLRPGEPVFIDDGKFGFEVEGVQEGGVLLRATELPPQGGRLRPDKGINLPESQLALPPLSEKDHVDLDFVATHADLVGLSFVEQQADVELLRGELARRGRPELPIIAKIETRGAVRNLPEILLGALGRYPFGVMIARGDLAVELGGERLAEVQEEILWLCEAAHVPVIWATQVLESLAKRGGVSRPEVTDAAMASRAECVMLNKGPYVVRAVRMLDDILARMQAHQYKKVARLRALHW